jgi:endonuclease/exonuclease/phosphatase family metal-dependent hydrolase
MSAPLFGPVQPPALHVMTFNLRRRMDGMAWRRADRWRSREPLVRSLLRTELPTIVGTQEAMPDQAQTVLDALGPRYRFVGRGRMPRGRGEGTPLFYDGDRLQLLEWEQLALSEHPHEAGSRSWGNRIPRIAVGASFRDRASGTQFFFVNTHLDPFSTHSRVRSAEAVRSLVAAQSLPAIVTGDMNAGEDSPALRAFVSGGTLVDAWITAERRVTPAWGTNANYRPPRQSGARIDWILTSPGIRVTDAGINARPIHGGWPSDHFPVQALLELPRTSPASRPTVTV